MSATRTRLVALLLLLAATGSAWAQTAAPGRFANSLPLMVAQGAGGTSYSVPVQTLLFITPWPRVFVRNA